jgi:hypothetical protein
MRDLIVAQSNRDGRACIGGLRAGCRAVALRFHTIVRDHRSMCESPRRRAQAVTPSRSRIALRWRYCVLSEDSKPIPPSTPIFLRPSGSWARAIHRIFGSGFTARSPGSVAASGCPHSARSAYRPAAATNGQAPIRRAKALLSASLPKRRTTSTFSAISYRRSSTINSTGNRGCRSVNRASLGTRILFPIRQTTPAASFDPV